MKQMVSTLLSAVSLTVARGCLRLSPLRYGSSAKLLLLMSFGLEARATVEDDDIRGPRPAVEILVPEQFLLTPWLIGAGIFAAAALFFWWWRRQRGGQRGLAPLERALHELAAIDRERNNLDAGPLADQAAGVVRRFIAERFDIAAPQRTTEEFLRSLTGDASPLATHAELLRGFLKSCDMAKFAGVAFDAAERHALLESAFRFVRGAGDQPPSAP